MKEVKIEEVRPGMILAGPTHDLLGNLLFDEGAELTAANLRILQAWGVKQVPVREAETVPSPDSAVHEDTPLRGKDQPTQRKTRRLTRRLTPGDKPPKAPGKLSDPHEELAYRFAQCLDNPLMKRIRVIAKKQLEISSPRSRQEP